MKLDEANWNQKTLLAAVDKFSLLEFVAIQFPLEQFPFNFIQ